MAREELIDYLIKLSDGKLFLAKQLLILTEQQGKSLDSKEEDKLNEIIAQKQSIMDRIDVLDDEFVKKYTLLKEGSLPDTLESFVGNEKNSMKLLQDKISEIFSITEKVQKLDVVNLRRLKQNMEVLQGEFKKVSAGKKAIKGYGNKSIEGISIFVDKMR